MIEFTRSILGARGPIEVFAVACAALTIGCSATRQPMAEALCNIPVQRDEAALRLRPDSACTVAQRAVTIWRDTLLVRYGQDSSAVGPLEVVRLYSDTALTRGWIAEVQFRLVSRNGVVILEGTSARVYVVHKD